MKLRHYLLLIYVLFSTVGSSQTINDSINSELVKGILYHLSSNRFGGRVNFTKEQLDAAEFLNNEFAGYGLVSYTGNSDFYIPFHAGPGKIKNNTVLKWNNKRIKDNSYFFFSHSLYINSKSIEDFMILKAELPLADSLLYYNWKVPNRDLLLWVVLPDGTSLRKATKNLVFPAGLPSSDILMVAAAEEPKKINFPVRNNQLTSTLYNIVGMIPGKSLPQEAIVFSAHYDHVDRGADGQRSGIYNGANDDASGTTAVLALAKYFAMRKKNERTLIFCLFAGEELGLLGSTDFAKKIKPSFVKANINIEMIGMTNRTGKNSFFVTGSDRSNLKDILAKNILNTNFKITEEKGDLRNLFLRSDNYSFFSKGIPAHSIMCSDDSEPCYHRPCDDAYRIDAENMTRVIKAIAKGCTTLIDGSDTPVLR